MLCVKLCVKSVIVAVECKPYLKSSGDMLWPVAILN